MAVVDEARVEAPILLVGEAPGKHEIEWGVPFAGPSGHKLNRWWKRAGLSREACYITNVYDELPKAKSGNLNEAYKSGWTNPGEAARRAERIHEIMHEMPNLKVVVPVGNWATWAVLYDKGRVPWERNNPGITSVRGCAYSIPGLEGTKAIPTIHPAAVMRQAQWERRCIYDWQKIARALHEPIEVPERTHIIDPTGKHFDYLLELAKDRDAVCAIDIESWGGFINCVGFSFDPSYSVTIPTMKNRQPEGAWEVIQEICAGKCQKVLQNGLFDAWWLRQYNIKVRRFWWDTLAMHHALDPMDSHSLDYLASVYTHQPYWKDEAKEADEIVKYARKGLDRLFVYNGLDCCVTRELFDVLYAELESRNKVPFYISHYADMFEPMLALMLTGVHINRESMQAEYERLNKAAIESRDAVGDVAGRPLWNATTKLERAIQERYQAGVRDRDCMINDLREGHTPKAIGKKWDVLQAKGISDVELGKLLVTEWKAAGRKKTDSGQYKTDNITLRKMQIANQERDERVCRAIDLALEHRRAKKLMSFIKQEKIDDDDRLRCTYKFTTKTGRFASSKNPGGTGLNLQNIDRELRGMFIPDPGHILLEVDQSQAEGRVVAALTGDTHLIEQARLRPSEFDMHTANAVLIYSTLWGRDVVPEEITKQMRYLGKRCLTPDHDVLTPWGWRGIADVKQGDIIAQWDRGRITFAPILEKFEYENTDPLTLLQQRGIDQCVTPNHRMVYMTNGRYKVAEAQQLPKGANIPTVGEYSGYIIPEYPPELLAAIQADANKSGKQFRFQLTKPRKVQRLLELCRMHNIPYTHTDRGTCQDITVKPHWRIPKDFGPFLLSWRGDIIDRLLAEIPFWDGYTTAGRTEYTTSVYNNAMWVHTLLHLRGNGSYMRHKKVKGGWTGKQFDAWTVSWNRRQFSCPDTRAVSMPGNVHCVSVPSSFFLVRRNDTISVTGNSVHAANYGMRGKKLSDILLKEHLTYTPQECDRLIGAYMEAQPAIRKWQRKTREVVLRRRRLFTNWGRDINFDGFRLDDELWRLAYAFIPQSEVGDLTNQWMLKPLYYWLKENHMKARIVLQVHDSVAVTCPPEEAYDVAEYLVGQIERPRRYGRCLGHSVELTIPAEVTIGKSWKGDFEWKVIPTREEFDDKVKELT